MATKLRLSTVRFLLFVCCGLLCMAPAHAQTEVPREVVDVLFLRSMFDGTQPRLLVGELPDALQDFELRRDERVVGTLVQRYRTLAAVAVRGAAEAVQQNWRKRVEETGWTAREPGPGEIRTGFVSTNSPVPDHGYCRAADDRVLQVRTLDGPGAETYVMLHVSPPGQCSRPGGQMDPRMMGPRNALPMLPPPPGAMVVGSGTSGSGTDVTQEAHVLSELLPAALLQHYGRAMAEQGWTALEETVGEHLGVSIWQKREDHGGTVMAWLTATRLPENHREMQIRVMRVPPLP